MQQGIIDLKKLNWIISKINCLHYIFVNYDKMTPLIFSLEEDVCIRGLIFKVRFKINIFEFNCLLYIKFIMLGLNILTLHILWKKTIKSHQCKLMYPIWIQKYRNLQSLICVYLFELKNSRTVNLGKTTVCFLHSTQVSNHSYQKL